MTPPRVRKTVKLAKYVHNMCQKKCPPPPFTLHYSPFNGSHSFKQQNPLTVDFTIFKIKIRYGVAAWQKMWAVLF